MTGTDELRDHQARCVPHVAILRMFAGDPAGTPLPPDATERLAAAIGAILIEAKAAGHTALSTADSRLSGKPGLLAARQARLEHAAEDALASAREAAENGNAAALRQRLQRFETLTSALWTVQLSLLEQASAPEDEALSR